MIKTAICYDNENELEQIYSHLIKYKQSKVERNFIVNKFRNDYTLLENIDSSGDYDIYILKTADGVYSTPYLRISCD